MKILFLTVGDKTVASSRVRVYGYEPFLAEKGIRYKILSFTSRAKCRRILELKKDTPLEYLFEILYKIYIIGKLFVLSKRYDVISVQKVILPKVIWNILKTLNENIIFDFDDAIYRYKDIAYLVRGAKAVIVSNRFLREFASRYNENVHELISPVTIPNPTSHIPNPKTITLGWIGSPETSRYLYPLMPVFKELKQRFNNLKIEFMGSGKNKHFESLDIKISDWSIEGEKGCLENIDIGIMPLENDEWSRSKAGYKLLLYMSRGVPCVASPIGINNEIIKNNISGYLAETPEEWMEKLSLLIKDYPLRQRLGGEGLRTAEESYSYGVCAPKILEVLTDTASGKRKGVKND